MMSQRTATVNAIMSVLANAGIEFHPGSDVRKVWNKELRAQVNAILFEGFRAGKIELKAKKDDDADLRKYVNGLQTNWLNKAEELNGGEPYVTKNPGSRASDPQLKALHQCLAKATTDEDRQEIQEYIAARREALGLNTKKVTINFDDLPAELKAKYAE